MAVAFASLKTSPGASEAAAVRDHEAAAARGPEVAVADELAAAPEARARVKARVAVAARDPSPGLLTR